MSSVRAAAPQYSCKHDIFSGVVERGRSSGHVLTSIKARSRIGIIEIPKLLSSGKVVGTYGNSSSYES